MKEFQNPETRTGSREATKQAGRMDSKMQVSRKEKEESCEWP